MVAVQPGSPHGQPGSPHGHFQLLTNQEAGEVRDVQAVTFKESELLGSFNKENILNDPVIFKQVEGGEGCAPRACLGGGVWDSLQVAGRGAARVPRASFIMGPVAFKAHCYGVDQQCCLGDRGCRINQRTSFLQILGVFMMKAWEWVQMLRRGL